MNPNELNITLDTWLVSDSHFLHANIVRFCNRPQDHDWLMRERWIEAVGARDTVLHLGDLTYRGRDEEVRPILGGLPGDKYLLLGNHDKKTVSWYKRYGFTVLEDAILGRFETSEGRTIRHTGFYWTAPDGRRVLFSHYPDERMLDWSVNIHGHIHDNGYPAGCPADRDYRNISVEVVDYRPQRLGDILNGVDGVNYRSREAAGEHVFVPRSQPAGSRGQSRGRRR